MKISIYFIVSLITVLLSCNKKEPIPAYIFIEKINVIPSAKYGSSSGNIVDVWVYQNDNIQGVYELPAKFPILASGQTKLKFLAGIKINGISNTRAAYPFYDFYETELSLVPGEVDTVVPSVSYFNPVNVAIIEDFESGNNFSNMERYNDTTLAFEGKGFGRIPVNNSNDTIVLTYSNNRFSVPFITNSFFVEMNYKNTHEFIVGLRGYKNSTSEVVTIEKLNVTVKEDWSKIYINFTPEIGRLQADEYELTIKYVKKSDITPVNILLDNIKVLYL
jgi:hypothetical protein